MTEQNSSATAGTRTSGPGAGFLRRMAFGTIAAAGVVGAMTMGMVGQAAPQASCNVAMVKPMQPPPPPPGWPPPELHQPGQVGPAPGQPNEPPSPEPPAGDDAICQVW